jgi:hypothetical protein
MVGQKKTSWFTLEFGFLLAFAAYGVSILLQSRRINPASAAFPRWVALLALLFIAIRIGSSVYRTYKPRQEVEGPSEEAEIQAAFVQEEIKAGDKGVVELPAKPTPWPYTLIMMVLFFVAIKVLGFTVSTLLYLVAAPYLMGYRKRRVILLVSGIMTLSLVGILSWFFKIPLPEGPLIKVIRGY